MLYAVLCLIGPFDLSHLDYQTREGETDRARACGPLAVPALRAAAQSGCPEARSRAIPLLRPFDVAATDRSVLAKWVAGPEPTAAQVIAIHDDDRERHRLAQAAFRAGLLSDGAARDLEAGDEPYWPLVMWGTAKRWDHTAAALRTARELFHQRGK